MKYQKIIQQIFRNNRFIKKNWIILKYSENCYKLEINLLKKCTYQVMTIYKFRVVKLIITK